MAITTLAVSSRCLLASPPNSKVKAVVPYNKPMSRLRIAPVVAFRDSKSSGQSYKATTGSRTTGSRTGKDQPLVQPLGKVPTNRKEEAEGIVLAVMIFGFFMTGVLFVTIPMFQVGGHAMTQSWQKAVNKGAGIKEPAIARPGYAPGPGPAAAPGTPAAGGNGCICP